MTKFDFFVVVMYIFFFASLVVSFVANNINIFFYTLLAGVFVYTIAMLGNRKTSISSQRQSSRNFI